MTTERIERLTGHATPPPWTLSADRQRLTQVNHVTRDVWTLPRTEADLELMGAAHDLAATALHAQRHSDALRTAAQVLMNVSFSEQDIRLLLLMGDGRDTPASQAMHARLDHIKVAQDALRALLDPAD